MIQKPKGTYDVFKEKGKTIKYLEKLLETLMEKYNYEFVRTPNFESSELFHRGVGETTDIVTKETYDFIDDNIEVLHLESGFINNPKNISKNDNFVSINTALMVDLMGQAASETIGTLQITGVGGQTDMIVGAKESKGGRSILALASTREVKNEDGTKKRISTLTSTLPVGTPITLSRNDIDFVVTEYGVASLRGASLKERAQSLIRIAHPDFRAELTEEAKRWYLL